MGSEHFNEYLPDGSARPRLWYEAFSDDDSLVVPIEIYIEPCTATSFEHWHFVYEVAPEFMHIRFEMPCMMAATRWHQCLN